MDRMCASNSDIKATGECTVSLNRPIRWILQNNLLAENDLSQLQIACETREILYENVTVIPFSSVLPSFSCYDGIENIYYGSTTFIENVSRCHATSLGLFYAAQRFEMTKQLQEWKQFMLNAEAECWTFSTFVQTRKRENTEYFIRPYDDSKAFDGTVMTFREICEWYERLFALEEDTATISPNSPIIVSPPYGIEKEWRTLIVEGKVVTASRYREHFRLSKSAEDCPEEMIVFAESRAWEYSPHDIFVLDIGLSGGEYYVIEAGCANAAGFYEMDIGKFVEVISHYVQSVE